MSKNKVHYNKRGVVIGFGDYESEKSLEIENFEEAITAFAQKKSLHVVDGVLVISESKSEKIKEIRAQRDFLLEKSDIELMKLEDSELISGVKDAERRQALAVYRQALRDITTQNPFSVVWPSLSGDIV